MSVENFLDPIICLRKKGTLDDPYVPVTESFTVVEGKVLLSQVPCKISKVILSGGGISGWTEITKGVPSDNEYRIDYVFGVVYLNPSRNGTSPTFTYKGTGALFFPYSRIWTREGSNLDVIRTLEDVMHDAMIIANQATEFKHKGNYNSSTRYYYRNLVDFDNQLFMCVDESINGIIGISPESGVSTVYWKILHGLGDHPSRTDNPHGLTKELIDLGNVLNEEQIPVSLFTGKGQIIYSEGDNPYTPVVLPKGYEGNILKMGEQYPYWSNLNANEVGAFKKEFLAELPPPSEEYRGEIRILDGGAGVADVVYMCIKNSLDEYEWKEVTLT